MRQLSAALVVIAVIAAPGHVVAVAVEPDGDAQIGASPCVAATAAGDADRIITVCGELIDDDKTPKPARIAALLARAVALAGKQLPDRALADYDAVLALDPKLPAVLNARGELWRGKGDRRRALADFAAALKLDPDHAAARASHRALVQELERAGALMAIASPPRHDCRAARRPVDHAICADLELATLDREIEAAAARVLREAGAAGPAMRRQLQREQAAYLKRRTIEFGRPDYDLRQSMRDRLRKLTGTDRY